MSITLTRNKTLPNSAAKADFHDLIDTATVDGAVSTDTTQTVTGDKTFSGTVTFNGTVVGASDLPSQAGNAGKVLKTDGTDPSWGQPQDLSIASQAQGDILYFNGTNWVRLGASTAGYYLKTQGTSANPAWAALPLPTDLSIASQAQGDILYFNGTNWVRLAAGTSGYFLKTQGAGANPIWGTQETKSTVLFSWSGFVDSISNTSALITDGANLVTIPPASLSNMYFSVNGNTDRVILRSKFLKTAGISTVAIHSSLWNADGGGGYAKLTVDIGGQTGYVQRKDSNEFGWATSANVTVSSLNNGTVYDIVIYLSNVDGGKAFCGSVVLIGNA